MRRRSQRGQSSIELLALVPVLIVVGLLGWQLASVIGTGLRAQAQVRAEAVKAVARATDHQVVVSVLLPVPGVLPGMDALRVPARIGIRTP